MLSLELWLDKTKIASILAKDTRTRHQVEIFTNMKVVPSQLHLHQTGSLVKTHIIVWK